MSRLLVDTHALLWGLTDDPALSPPARVALADPANELLVSAASIWEIAIKRFLGKLTAPDNVSDQIIDQGFTWLPVTAAHAWQVRDLPVHLRDPFDRLIIAQALVESIPIITTDARFDDYDVTLIW
jgi:PIN domain nuclease of toxin-antitoxin system